MGEFSKEKRDDTTSEDASDTASDSPIEKDRDSIESSPEPETPEDEVMDQQGPEGEAAVSKEGTSSEDELDTSPDLQVEDDSYGGESSHEEDGLPVLQTDLLAEVNQNIVELQQLQTDSLTEVNKSLSGLRQLFEVQIARNANQNKMFDATHREMKEYKENFLLEAIHKPIIQNLIGFHDSFKLIESQLNDILKETEDIRSNDLSQFQKNLENMGFELEEILYRLDVTPYEERLETLDRKLHKTLDTRPADSPEQDRKVAEVHKIGFYWRDKIFRPEEVTIFRYMPSPTEKGEERDG